jgi:hypothetical protein
MRLYPELVGHGHGIDAELQPPLPFFGGLVNLAMVRAADRHGELIADLAAQGLGLGETQMVGVGRLAAAVVTDARLSRAVPSLYRSTLLARWRQRKCY